MPKSLEVIAVMEPIEAVPSGALIWAHFEAVKYPRALRTLCKVHFLFTLFFFFFYQGASEDVSGDHHFRKPANDITSQLEINFGDLGRPGRGRGGSRGGRGGRGGGNRAGRGGGRSEKVSNSAHMPTAMLDEKSLVF